MAAILLLTACDPGGDAAGAGNDAVIRKHLDQVQQDTDAEAREAVDVLERTLNSELTYNRMAFESCHADWLGDVSYSGRMQFQGSFRLDDAAAARKQLAKSGWHLDPPKPVRRDLPKSSRAAVITGTKDDLSLSLGLGPIGIADLTLSYPCVETSKDVSQEYRTKDHTLDR